MSKNFEQEAGEYVAANATYKGASDLYHVRHPLARTRGFLSPDTADLVRKVAAALSLAANAPPSPPQ
jgi:hypothetical protein